MKKGHRFHVTLCDFSPTVFQQCFRV